MNLAAKLPLTERLLTRLAYRQYGREAGDKALKSELDSHFIYIEPLMEALEMYEENRDQYPTLVEYHPLLIRTIETRRRKSIRRDISKQ